jgi:Uma2 family endonuclease
MSKVTLKILFCLDHGTEMAWLIDPDESLIFTYEPGKQSHFFESVDAIVPAPAFAESVQLRVGEIFGWLAE